MSASSGSGGSSQPPSPQHQADYLEWHYDRYMKYNRGGPEVSGGWSWEPYIKSLIEEELKYPQNRGLFHEPPRGSDSGDDSDSDGEVPDDEDEESRPVEEAKPPENLPLGQAGGSWNYLLYAPAWTDPNLASNLKPVYGRQPGLQYENLPPRNLLERVRPALRADDAALNPTACALRFGIYPGRDDGRSRMTPPYLGTTDYNKGINECLLRTRDEPALASLRQETQAQIEAGTTTYRGDGVAPEVIDEARRAHNIPGQEDLFQHAMDSDEPFSRFVRNMPAGFDPEPFKDMINSALGDENYQRLLLADYTTDELLRGGVYSMTDDYQSSMNHEPLHELLVQERWITSASKGAIKKWPRVIYEIDGRCNEWDVHNNVQLWAALQPALQLVTKVLKSGLPFWRAVKDLRTRTAIPTELDPRPEEDRATPRLVRIRPLEEALADGAVQDWPVLYDLVEQGLDYEKAVDYVLRKTLKLDIGSGYLSNNGRRRSDYRHGETSVIRLGQDSTIKTEISAEILWPLLVPNYSDSEKLTTSFLVAAVLLHELMHATADAVDLLCRQNSRLWIPNVTRNMAFELRRWHDGNVDPDTAIGEPWYHEDVHAELGLAFEHDFFGLVVNTLSRNFEFLSPSVLTLPFILSNPIWPSRGFDTGRHNVLADGRKCRPIQAQEPLPIQFFARFFTQAFWDDAVPTYGFRAFRRRNPDRTVFFSLPREVVELKNTFRARFGARDWRFFLFVIRTLKEFGYHLLSHWLRMILARALAHIDTESVARWRRDFASWERSDGWWEQAIDDLDQAKASGDTLWGVVSNLGPDAYQVWATNWGGPENPAGPCPAYEAWVQTAQQAYAEHFKEGGPFFTALTRLHDLALAAQGEMEYMVFEFLTLPLSKRQDYYERAEDNPPNVIPWLLERLDQYRAPLQVTVAALDAMSNNDIFQTEAAQWSARCQAVVKMLSHLAWLIRSHSGRSDEENQGLRDHLRSVPSAYWEGPEVRLREVAMQEYQLVTPAIRAVIDEFDRRLRAGLQQQQPQPQPQPQPPPQPSPPDVIMGDVDDTL